MPVRVVSLLLGNFYRLLGMLGICLLLSGPIFFLWQCFFWLKNHTWPGYTLYKMLHTGIRKIPKDWIAQSEVLKALLDWFYRPESWLGLHLLVVGLSKLIPFALVLLMIGGFFGIKVCIFSRNKLEQYR